MAGPAGESATVSIDRVIPPAERRRVLRAPTGLAGRVRSGLAASLAGTLLTLSLPTGPVAAHPHGARSEEDAAGRAALAVSIDTLTPPTPPRRGTLTGTGGITNHSQSAWTAMKV